MRRGGYGHAPLSRKDGRGVRRAPGGQEIGTIQGQKASVVVASAMWAREGVGEGVSRAVS